MSKPKVYTNKHWRQFKYREEVPDQVLAEQFDYLDGEIDGFFCYRSYWYHTSDFMMFDRHAPFDEYWDGYSSDSFFSGVLIKLADDGEEYQVATYIG